MSVEHESVSVENGIFVSRRENAAAILSIACR